jgi:hypothetical protein
MYYIMEVTCNKKNKKGSKNTTKAHGVCEIQQEKDDFDADSDTEMAVLPMRHFHALIENKDYVINEYDNDRLRLACELKGIQEEKELYAQALNREKGRTHEYKTKCTVQEKELDKLRNKTKMNPAIKDIITKSKEILEVDKREDRMNEYYKKHYASKIDDLRKQLELE